MKNKGFTLTELLVAMAISTAVFGITMFFLVYQSRYSSEALFTMKAQKLIYNVLMDLRLDLMQAGPYDQSQIAFNAGANSSILEIDTNCSSKKTTYEFKNSTLYKSTVDKKDKAVLGPSVEVDIDGKTVMQPIMGGTFQVEGFTRDTTDPKLPDSVWVMKLDYSWKVGSHTYSTSDPGQKPAYVHVTIPDYCVAEMIIDADPDDGTDRYPRIKAIRKLIVGGQ
jgi:prepilin-type N-terminal cleavage/methylation domain-containing protein